MKNINCLVADDEKLARTLLKNYIEKLPNLELTGECKNAFEVMAALKNDPVDLLFLDIQMPQLTGIELLNTLPQKPLVVFTTAYPEYALQGYQLDVVDYLLKPFRFDRFAQAVNKAARRLNLETAPPATDKPFILVKASHTTHKVFLDDILYIQGMKEYVAYHLPGKRIISLQSLKQLEAELPPGQFVRIHRSYIVPVAKVTVVDGRHVHIGREKLPIGGSYKDGALKLLF